ncbi:hypothetical protein D9M71_156810 [compost metagenome]
MCAMRRVSLYANLIDTPEQVEVIDVERAQVDLQGLEHLADGNPQLLGLGAIQVDAQLRHVDLVGAEQRRQLRLPGGFGDKVLSGLVEGVVTQVSLILQL